jgi:hypothetical protein
MKKALLALVLVLAISPLTFAQKTDTPTEKSAKKKHKKAKKAKKSTTTGMHGSY